MALVTLLESALIEDDYLLDKSTFACFNSFMESNPHFFLGLAAAASFRKSFLIEVSNFLVGTFRNSSLLPLSMRGVL
jgi:hypothetical protein